MAHSVHPRHFRNGFMQPSSEAHWTVRDQGGVPDDDDLPITYELPPSVEMVTSSVHNGYKNQINTLRTWPTIFDGTASPHRVPEWWKPPSKVDVLIVGADGVQPRFLETLATWGLASEVQEEGPLIERTAIYYDGKLLHHGRSHQSDSRYRGLHIITQGQIERIYIRDLLRHRMLVERNTTLKEFSVDEELARCSGSEGYPVQGIIENSITGAEERIEAKYLVGSDGASSSIRKTLGIPFDGISTNIYWGIMDCVFETDYPHAWIFGSVVSSTHGGCVIIPRENGYIRLYTQLDVSHTGPISRSRQARDPTLAESGGQIDIHSITPDEVLEQANRIFAPYRLKFGAPLSWFAIWKISERVARSFSSPDLRVHLVGDAGHVHSVMGAFGLNASILDAANLAWKIGLSVKNRADFTKLLPTYDRERRLHAAHIIEVSGKYLRFVCSSPLPTATLYHVGADLGIEGIPEFERISPEEAKAFVGAFFAQHGPFLLGVDAPYGRSCLNPPEPGSREHGYSPIQVYNGVRAPNPRLCLDDSRTGYLYDCLPGPNRMHLVLFGWDLCGAVREQLRAFSNAIQPESGQGGFYWKYGGPNQFNLVLVAKGTPQEIRDRLAEDELLQALGEAATVLSDDRAPDEDAHSTYGVHHRTGAVVVIRPDLWVGYSAAPRAA
ncbi:FAD binding domain-containing protein [Aspergillus pseudodeflectus]|uniref:FAD binding domain-containing protein n=1 Tax=Aspergillus pseudodeflectus TaxID=176178 RepID=A0ABR4L160_9EURO